MISLRRLFFNLWYFGNPPWDSGISPPELIEFIDTHPPGRAIDLGCGTGTNVITLARAGWEVHGIDFASRAISIARRKADRAGIRAVFHTDDATVLRHVTGLHDLALDMGCFHGLEERDKYLLQLDRILAPGGIWLLYGFLKTDPRDEGPGLTDATLKAIHSHSLELLSRRDGFDKHQRPSAWFMFKRNP